MNTSKQVLAAKTRTHHENAWPMDLLSDSMALTQAIIETFP
jgi:hypothetical protein